MGPKAQVVISRTPEQTLEMGEELAKGLKPGDCLALVGELGAGKTTLIKGLARGLGIPDNEVISPTFILVREHRSGRLPLYHVDAYRIRKPEEALEIGLEEYLFSLGGVTVIEWADRIQALVPRDCVEITMEILSPKQRRISISSI